ncbi:MAG TPA: glucose-1-phosphate thymidylyltransferase [Euryarchaeota archaeon]|nr:bifunctional protein GlmU [archaeon BMS3Abin16]GBE56039.1 bifunctional protein GlmU [archaeon BMS3Bbin16]HDH27538.1 glucose-1-phosphate thymidylyltransferase [Euryarchaeota archaeon]HDY74672.1 glucose-1-phosphate thymidylyltransferase [Euryarchaeota archaeon]
MLDPGDFFELESFEHSSLFNDASPVWNSLKNIKGYIEENIAPNVSEIRKKGDTLPKTLVVLNGEIFTEGFELECGSPVKGEFKVKIDGKKAFGASVLFAGASILDDTVQIGDGTVVEPGALIKGPTIIGRSSEIRQGAYIRGSTLIGERCIVGHATEMKNAVMLNRVTAGHFAYIGDSILGSDVNLGAGTKLANLSIIKSPVNLRIDGVVHKTGLKKFGAILGDSCDTGCNSVTSPGTLLGKRSIVVPNATVPNGYHPPKTIIR